MRLCLASASEGRRETLTRAGITPEIVVSDVDEDALVATLVDPSPREFVLALARAKAEAVRDVTDADLIIGCDSMFVLDGQILGKPYTAEVARERLRSMAGRTGTLLTGHWLIGSERAVGDVSVAEVTVAHMTDEEIEAYIGTGEPLWVAGSFTIDGYGGPFITSITGDHHGVTGLSLPMLRELMARLGHSIIELW